MQLKGTKKNQIGFLLDHLMKKGRAAIDDFCTCLTETEQHHIVEKYLTAGISHSESGKLEGI